MTDIHSGKLIAPSHSSSELLTINEIFFSLQGETSYVGLPTVFIRLTGCPLRCQYCDTQYAYHEGERLTIEHIMETVAEYKTPYITVTGGEPLAQRNCHHLLQRLCDADYTVSLETSGAFDISKVDKRASKIVDIKTPASQEAEKNRYENFKYLTENDEIKFVICNRDDYLWSKAIIEQYSLADKHRLLFSSSHQELSPTELADWIVHDQLPVRMQLQLHKYLWGDIPGK